MPLKLHILSTNFFCNFVQKIEDKIIHTDTKYQDFLDNSASQTLFLSLLTQRKLNC